MAKYTILGIHVQNRKKHVGSIQKVLTKHGHEIKTRLGIHHSDDESPTGLIILEIKPSSFKAISDDLKKIEGIELKSMKF